jgi:hypothetical protein
VFSTLSQRSSKTGIVAAAGAFSPAAALPFLAVFIYKINILALSVTYGDSSPKGRALGIAAKFPVKP